MSKPSLLIIDDDEQFQGALRRALRAEYEVLAAHTPDEVFSKLSPPPDVILLDLRLDEKEADNYAGLTLLETLRRQQPEVPVLMITGYPDVEVAVEAMRLGAVDFLQKSTLKINEIKARLARALEHRRLARRVAQLEQELSLVEPRQIIGNSPIIREIKRVIEAVARDGDVTILIRGETGTGKELIARAIHANGRRRGEPFVPVMLNALPQATLEAELFGHEAGAFTDARVRRAGYLEKAHGGILLLDEIGEVDAHVQLKLLRFLEEREFQRLGSTKSIKVDVQVIAATNANMEEQVREGRFREDLYFRLKVHEILLPPLRTRAEDIPLLVEHLLQVFHHRGKRIQKISPQALEALQVGAWPGNIRQLKNTLESAIFQAELHAHRQIEIDDLPADVHVEEARLASSQMTTIIGVDFSIQEALARDELTYVVQALDAAHGKKTEAWRLLGFNDRFTFSRRVRRILAQYPQLGEEFPRLRDRFERKGNNEGVSN